MNTSWVSAMNTRKLMWFTGYRVLSQTPVYHLHSISWKGQLSSPSSHYAQGRGKAGPYWLESHTRGSVDREISAHFLSITFFANSLPSSSKQKATRTWITKQTQQTSYSRGENNSDIIYSTLSIIVQIIFRTCKKQEKDDKMGRMAKHTRFMLDFWNPDLLKDSYLLICSSVNWDKMDLKEKITKWTNSYWTDVAVGYGHCLCRERLTRSSSNPKLNLLQ